MKINTKFLYAAMASMVLAGCGDDWNEDKLDGFGKYEETDVKQLELTLTDADYKSIATNTTNKSLASAAGLSGELSKLTNNKYFTNEISASTYIPAYLAATYPTADDKSSVKVTYNQLVGEPAYLAAFGKAEVVDLAEEAYESVWGDKVQAYFLTPKTEGKIAKLLKESMPDAAKGDMALVNYAYSEVEPSIGGGSASEKVVWTPLSFPKRASGTNWNFVNIGPIDLSEYKGQTVYVGFSYTSSESVYAKWELSNFKALSLPYLDVLFFKKQDDGSFKKIIKSSEFEAGEYVIAAAIPNGGYNLVSTLSKNYGYMPVKAIDNMGDVISADEAENCVLTFEAVDGGYTMKAPDGRYTSNDTGRENYTLTDKMVDGNFVWDVAVLRNSDAVALTNVATGNTMKLNYYAKGNSYSFGCYPESKLQAASCLADPANADANFTTYDVNLGDLSALWKYDTKYNCWVGSAGKGQVTESFLVSPAITIAEDAALPYFTIDEAFKFATADASDLTIWISTNYKPEAATRAMTRSVSANKSAIYSFDGADWAKATVTDATLAVLQPADYAVMGNNINLAKYANLNYPYAKADDKLVVVYVQSNQATAKELVHNGTEWTETTKVAQMTDQFVKSEGVWKYDPSVVITLPAGKGQELSTLFFQTATDWVWENIDVPAGCTAKGQGYVTSYGNNEYYCGCSAYQGNVDWRFSAAQSQAPDKYAGMSDDDFLKTVKERYIEVMGHVLGILYPSAQPVTGVKVTYTINFAVYTGVTTNWTMQYELTGVGQFTYIEDSLKEVA